MGLTSDKVLALAILIAVVLFIGTVWLWPRLARQSWRAVSGRIGLLLSTQVALFACVGLAANQAFGFYASWADLFGKETGQGAGHRPRGGRHRRRPAPGGLHLRRTGGERHAAADGRADPEGEHRGPQVPPGLAGVRVPAAGYFQPQYRTRTFPVSVVLTGYPGTARSLVDKLNYPSTAQRLAKEGRVQPMILVMLRPTVAPPRDTECVDVPGGPQAETFFAKDLPDAVRGHYRVGKRARSWGIIGDSTGGYCALKLAMHHPNVYAAGAGLSAYYKAPIDPTTGDLFHGDKKLQNRADLFWFLQHEEAPDTSLLVTSSKVGEHNYKDTLRFIDRVQATNLTRISSIILDSGGHNFNTWRREIPPTLQWISGRLSDR